MTTPTTIDAAREALASHGGRPRAGGTDVVALAQIHRAEGPYVELRRLSELSGVTPHADGTAMLGATTTIAAVAADPTLRARFPALSAAANALATPQVRAVATVGGNLLQRNRCPYFRNPAFSCFQTDGDSCPARAGDHVFASVIDQGRCVAPHPSSLAVALLAYGARVHLAGGDTIPVSDLYDGADPTRDHQLDPGQLVTGVELPAPTPGETAAHQRATSRSRAEWPMAEVVARIACSDGRVTEAVVAVGAVARTPLRLTEVERALIGAPTPGAPTPGGPPPEALDRVTESCTPLPGNAAKVDVLRATVSDALELALDAS
ncbi:FAD binding domain-containing protein [Spiractinospora alimapuensis]|uniref:FAD binding domain-containing protein n=1 Tax=Spiractinospora alimapuensis TaxID=2820884 RepID=UPI001F1D12EF|nr:FAD binding domain-containing protein [Spiractinospora alimapuensis]QVQ52245.1 FAD binding domain-containing protein [Spiractinospora alimapuensis]